MGAIMILRAVRNKTFNPGLMLPLALTLLGPGCASAPSTPENGNHAPVVLDVEVSGSRPVVAAGTLNILLTATTSDIDGDALSFTWSGDGSFHSQDDAAKTVRWDVPADSYGDLGITCVANDGESADSLTKTFEVGRSLSGSDYGDFVGDTVTWSTDDAPFYILQGDVTIAEGENLVIDPGVTIWCANDRLLTVNGSITTTGDAAHRVIFKAYTADTQEKGYWEGISFQSSTGRLALDYCNINNANIAVDLSQGSGLGAEFNFCGFFHSGTAMSAGFAELAAFACTVEDCSKGISVDFHSEVSIRNCTFRDTIDPALLIRFGSSGECESCFFTDTGDPAISISGGSYLTFRDNSFPGDGQIFLVGDGYGASPEDLDARCNWWGDSVSEADILGRIDYSGADTAALAYSPWKPTSGADCGGGSGPLITGEIEVVYDARHPLWPDGVPSVDFTMLAADGWPRLLRLNVDNQGELFVHDYVWTASEGALFFEETPYPESPPEDQVLWPGQGDDLDGSEIFIQITAGSGTSVTATATDAWEQSAFQTTEFGY